MSIDRERPTRLYQCPGCWSWGMYRRPTADGTLECECGERLTRVDLRDSEVRADAYEAAAPGDSGERIAALRKAALSALDAWNETATGNPAGPLWPAMLELERVYWSTIMPLATLGTPGAPES